MLDLSVQGERLTSALLTGTDLFRTQFVLCRLEYSPVEKRARRPLFKWGEAVLPVISYFL